MASSNFTGYSGFVTLTAKPVTATYWLPASALLFSRSLLFDDAVSCWDCIDCIDSVIKERVWDICWKMLRGKHKRAWRKRGFGSIIPLQIPHGLTWNVAACQQKEFRKYSPAPWHFFADIICKNGKFSKNRKIRVSLKILASWISFWVWDDVK
jgi:hypothetical protein